MPTTAQQPSSPEEPGRIIYLGDVRRRRAASKRAPDRQYLFALGLVAFVSWTIWLSIFLTVPPSRLLTYLAFFAPLWAALAVTSALCAYAVEWMRGLAPSLGDSTRRGMLIATGIVINLAVLAAHVWNPIVGVVTMIAAGAIEVTVMVRQRQGPPRFQLPRVR